MSDDPSYQIHTSESDGDLVNSWATANATQFMVLVEPVVESKMRMTSLSSLFVEPQPVVKTLYPPLLTKPDAVGDYTSPLCLIHEKYVTNAKSL